MSDTDRPDTPPVVVGCVGCGNMGAAIMRGLAKRDDLQLVGCDLNREKAEELAGCCGMDVVDTPREVIDKADYVLLCVKPQHMLEMLQKLSRHLQPRQVLISIAAGLKLAKLKEAASGTCPMVRVMPNTPAMVGAGVFAVCLDDPTVKDAHRDVILSLFDTLGQVHVLHESQFDAFTAVVGSGPAYVFYFMEALIESAVTLGLPRPQATEMVQGLVSGSAKLVEESDTHLSLLREMVTSPGGTTIAALNHFDRQAVRSALGDGVRASFDRSRELGK